MIYNITTFGKRQTFRSFSNPKVARAYLNRKKKEGFTFIKNTAGEQSELSIAVFDGRVNVWISRPESF